jgi:hypothetical protein
MILISPQAQTIPTNSRISPFRAIYVQDQRDRGVLMADNGDELKSSDTTSQAKDLNWDEITKHDEERRKQVKALLADGKATTAQDFRDAAFIFQHGQTSDDYLLAHVLATEAIVLGDTSAKWIAAATLDRYLQTVGQKQIFGTQYLDAKLAYYYEHRKDADLATKIKDVPSRQTQQPYNDKLLADPIRLNFCVPDQATQQAYVDAINSGKPADIPRIANCVR